MEKNCKTCKNLVQWCPNVYLCTKKKNTVSEKSLSKKTCENWRKK